MKLGVKQAFINTSLRMAFETARVKVTVTKNRKLVSGQLLEFKMEYFIETWCIVTFYECLFWDGF
jgi:hypothetical protein